MRRVSTCLTACLVLAACAEEREPINRVQPFALDKQYFVGEDLTDAADDPEFWTQATLIDVGYGAAQDGLFTSTYAQPMSRVRWQITEDHLIARVAYERIDGSDGKGLGGPTQDGIVAAIFRIERHFDIANQYNSTTGEQLNVVEENSYDRPWFERRYFRVDWSRNLSTDNYDFDTLSMLGIFGGITYEPVSYDVTDPDDPDAPVFALEDGYFDITYKAFARPQTVDISGLGIGIDMFPACFLDPDFSGGTGPSAQCSPVELTIRHSFRRVEDTDYEPKDWDGFRFQAYGAFTVERKGYARNYGMTDDQWRRFITRYDIWERSHFYEDPENMTGAIECFTPDTTPFGADANRDEDGNGTADECEDAGRGSQCDTFNQKCTLPYAERTPKPVVWYYTRGSDLEFWDSSYEATHNWDVAMRVAVRSAQYAECVQTGGSKDSCLERFPMYFGQQEMNDDAIDLAWEVDACRNGLAYPNDSCEDVETVIAERRGYDPAIIEIARMPEMVVLCHSPVEANDPEACGGPRLPSELRAEDCAEAWETRDDPRLEACNAALSVREGDLRYHQVNVIPDPQTPSPWGIYTDSEDPLTGQTVSASINVWSHVNDIWSQRIIDRLRLLEGELTVQDVTEGTNVRDWARAASAAARGGLSPKMDTDEVGARLSEFTGLEEAMSLEQLHEMAAQVPQEVREEALRLRHTLSHEVAFSLDAPSAMRPVYAARAAQARGTEFEAELLTPMVQQMMGIDGMPASEGVLNLASPLRGANPSLRRDLYNLKQNALAKRGACIMHEAPAPVAMTGLSDILQAKFGAFNPDDDPQTQQARAERMRRYIARRAHFAVMSHEMGHSIGLRHNFVSSSDASSYRPEYWQLRTKNGTVDRRCSRLGDGEDCVGPRYFDQMTDNEEDNLIWMWMHSTVMEYPGESTQELLGLGAYDFAAARMFYGDTVAVFEDEDLRAGTPLAQGMLGKTDSFGGIIGYQWATGPATDTNSSIHYSELQKNFRLIDDCRTVNQNQWKPATWNEDIMGEWHPVIDGGMVSVDGEYTRCSTRKVDYVQWDTLRMPTNEESGGLYQGGQSVDPEDRIRVPYGFGTDGWADVGNLSVYRSDNGADPYELFDFFIAQQEINHIFDNYRRNRNGFSVRNAVNRTLGRYNEKMRDGAKGLGLLKNVYAQLAVDLGWDFDGLWPSLAPLLFGENILASGIAFDHITRMMARPEDGDHYLSEATGVLLSSRDVQGQPGETVARVPNGVTGYYNDVSVGGRPVENDLADDQGEYDSQFTVNAGSYYEKLFSAYLLTESVDNFVSSSRTDFTDPRYRAVSMADLFPEGYRRWLANNLTGDVDIKGPRAVAGRDGMPRVDDEGFLSEPIGWTTWWGSTPRLCFPADGTTICGRFGFEDDSRLQAVEYDDTVPIDPQVGWEQQKFLIAWTLLYLPENEQQRWIDQLRVWERGVDADPAFENRIEFHNPTGKIYVAKTFGKETIFGKRVQRGPAARVLEYANALLEQAYEVTGGPDIDGDGEPDWWLPVLDPTDGRPIVKWDPTISAIVGGAPIARGRDGCNADDNSDCECSANRACITLEQYAEVPFFLRQAMDAYGVAEPQQRGIY